MSFCATRGVPSRISTRNMLDMSRGAERERTESSADHRPEPRDGRARFDPVNGVGIRRGRATAHIEVHSCPEKALSDGPQRCCRRSTRS